jgi:FixJ family two-component response regulator
MLRRVQERHGVGSIPVVMFSGQLEGNLGREAEERGAQGFVGKPFDLRALIEQTRQIVPV